jgi:curved DNA-binding protein CbpA
MSTQPDPYKILGVAKDAQLPEIRSAHRKLVLKCHPDKVQDPTLKAQKQDEFQRVQTAYELLADEKERKRYDDQARLAELREQMRAKAAASASSRQTATAASPSSSRPTPTSTAYKYEIHTPERTYKSPRQPSPGPRGYSSYSRSYEDDHPRAADIFEGVRTVRREKSYQDKTSRREEREREEREREKEYAREMREREKEKEQPGNGEEDETLHRDL